jgi:antitoxin VapB
MVLGGIMRTARVFNNGNSQAVRLPKQFRIAASEVFIRKDAGTGDIVLSTRPTEGGWAEFFALRDRARLPKDFMNERPMNALEAARDPFAMSAAVPAGGLTARAVRGKKR